MAVARRGFRGKYRWVETGAGQFDSGLWEVHSYACLLVLTDARVGPRACAVKRIVGVAPLPQKAPVAGHLIVRVGTAQTSQCSAHECAEASLSVGCRSESVVTMTKAQNGFGSLK